MSTMVTTGDAICDDVRDVALIGVWDTGCMIEHGETWVGDTCFSMVVRLIRHVELLADVGIKTAGIGRHTNSSLDLPPDDLDLLAEIASREIETTDDMLGEADTYPDQYPPEEVADMSAHRAQMIRVLTWVEGKRP